MHDWNPRDAELLKDQRQAYDEMRERCPVAHSEPMGWSVFRHADITAVLADPQTYSSVSRFPAIPNGMDPPEHGRYREALAPHFSKENMDRLEPRARAIVVGLLEPLLESEGGEFVDDFAVPFTLQTLCAMLGWPAELWECLAGWTHGNQQAAFSKDPVAGQALHKLFSEHVEANLEAHRASPDGADNATAAMMYTRIDGKLLDDDQIVTILGNWTGGHGTVAAALSISLLHLADDRELQDRLRKDSSLTPAAVEEILRSDGPLVANRRITTRPVQIQGQDIPKDESLSLMWIAANRDPRAFDDAESVNIERETDISLLWGQGIHLCQGAPLARIELRLALEELLKRTSDFELARQEIARTTYPGNGLISLHLRCQVPGQQSRRQRETSS